MPRRRRTAAELRRELHELRDSYISDGIELSELANALRSYKRASEFIRRYDPSHPQYEAAVQEKESSEELAKKGKALLNLDDRIKRARLREEFDAAQASRANDSVSGPPQQSNASSNRADSAGPQQESRANDPSGPPLAHPQQPQQPASYQTSRQRTRSRRARSQPRADGPALDCPQCPNCRRRQFQGAQGPYRLRFRTAHSSRIRLRGVFKHVVRSTGRNAREYTLCSECFDYLVEQKDPKKCAWPAFYWRLLSGSQESKFFGSKRYFFQLYDGETLWRFIPQTMRKWWIDAVRNDIVGVSGVPHPYEQCTVDYPAAFFRDKTVALRCFNADYNSGKLAGVVRAMENQAVVNRNVLCPWNCSTSCRDGEAGRAPLDLMIQRMLPRVILPLFSGHERCRLFHFSSEQYRLCQDDLPVIMLNDDWRVEPSVIWDEDGLQVCTCKSHDGGHDKMTLFPPRSTSDHILNADQTDQLAPFVQVPRVTKSMKQGHWCTQFKMVECRAGFNGTSTMDATNHSDFSKTSLLLSEHEATTIVGRPDIFMLLQQKAENGQISSDLAQAYADNARERFAVEDLRRNTQGATYVPFQDMIRVQLFESSSEQQVCFIDDRPRRRGNDAEPQQREVWVRRSWPILINMLQTEDRTGYGTQFRAIPKFNTTNVPSALLWTVFGMIAGCSELWHVIDTKPTAFRWSGWEGWILTAIQSQCFEFDPITVDRRSPITKLTRFPDMASKVNAFVPPELEDEESGSTAFYKLNIGCFRRLFPAADYSSTVAVVESMEESVMEALAGGPSDLESKKIVIAVGDAPTCGRHTLRGSTFELRVVCVVRAKERGGSPSHYDAIRYVRHGGGFSQWQKQERSDNIVTHSLLGEDLYESLQDVTEEHCDFVQCISVYVRLEDVDVDHWRSKFFEAMGGKSHVLCQCCSFPLVPTNQRDSKCICNMRRWVSEDGNVHTSEHNCRRKEAYLCTNVGCDLRVCRACYNSFPVDTVSTLIPPASDSDAMNFDDPPESDPASEAFNAARAFNEDDEEEEGQGEEAANAAERGADDSAHRRFDVDSDDDSLDRGDFLLTSRQDTTLDETRDNVRYNEGFATTNAGVEPANVRLDRSEVRVGGHVIFNQAGKCTTRKNYTIEGTSREKNMVQSLCATIPGQASPLLQPLAGLFPRHFYAAAENDECSILGAEPLFLFCSQTYAYGFTSRLLTARMHMTNPLSTTSTDPNIMCAYYDVLGNIVMSNSHSRDIFERGFVVDDKSPCGMSVREKDHTKLAGSVDSRKMVMNLSSSQKYIKWTWFLTFTANQREHPGLAHLHEWVRSGEWKRKIPGFDDLSEFEQVELERAMEQSFGVHVFSNWAAVKYLLLKHIKEHCSRLGTSLAIFARDEYQGESGNLCHNHLIVAIDKSTMNGETEKYIQDLIRTSFLEVLKTDEDVQRLIDEGLLKSIDEVPEVAARAETILGHTCDWRCQGRTGDEEGPENFRCRKPHSVRDNPDPLGHSYVPIPYNFQLATLDVLEEIGMYIPPAADEGDDIDDVDERYESPTTGGSFTHAYFVPLRHIAPCNPNATDNMSPVIPEFFCATKSMQNAQSLDYTNGIVKYVCKYLTKFDQGNYVLLCQDIHTGDWVLAKKHLHNTKIVSSKYNEDKAFAKSRTKAHPRGRDMPHFEIRQILMGDPEVFTNLEFIELSTLPFELRPTNSIKLDSQGNVVEEDQPDAAHPPDAFASGPPMQQIRSNPLLDLPEEQTMTENQVTTYRNHDGRASKYSMICTFSLRPPELLGVFRNPVDYFRCCHIEETQMKVEDMESGLCSDLAHCMWIDCFGRRVRIRELAVGEVSEMIEVNLTELNAVNDDDATNREFFRREINEDIAEMIRVRTTPEEELDQFDREYAEDVKDFFHRGESDQLPIPVVSGVSPENAQQFLTHIILSLGKYDTEIDALTKPTIRDSLRGVGLIEDSDELDSLKRYSARLARKYVKEQMVFYPNSLNRAETFLIMSKTVFDDAIIHNALAMNELPPFTMTGLRAVQTEANERFWTATKENQLNSVYETLQHTTGLPSREEVMQVTRSTPLEWDAVQTLARYERQSQESFAEQREAVEWFVRQIDKYRTTHGHTGLTHTKNLIAYGAPGAGKSFVGQYSVLYAMSQGLKILSTTLMGIRATALGGINLHQIFKLPFDVGSSTSPFRVAQLALQKLRQGDPTALHAILTMDAIFLDEAGQNSAEQLRAVDIILRKLRKSQIPFGGVLILGTMDPSQLKPIGQLPFLTSSMMLTCFMAYELKHSVRAHGDPAFQRLQAITRMSPFELLSSSALRDEFFELAGRLTYVDDWNDRRIGPNMMRAFSRKRPAQDSLAIYRRTIVRQLDEDGEPYRIARSQDTQRVRGSNGNWAEATEQTVRALDKDYKEPSELVLFVGGLYECTINDRNRPRQYSQSQLAFLLELPSEEAVTTQQSFPFWIAPPGNQTFQFDRNTLPTREELVASRWTEVRMGTTPARLVPARYGIQARRIQYSLKHIGATTINKAQGATLPLGIAVEITREYSPWESGQIVVSLSRSLTMDMTIIVGERNYAINKMWELITTFDQWTKYTKHVLDLITINRENPVRDQHVFNFPEVYPFRLQDIDIPLDSTGFVYCLIAKRTMDRIYIGQTENLSQRIILHNAGTGAVGTADARHRPWGIAAYICGLAHMNERERMSLERRWKTMVESLRSRGQDSPYPWISAGAQVVAEYNNHSDSTETIHFVLCTTPTDVNGGWHPPLARP